MPDVDIGNIDTVIDELAPPNGSCYFMDCATNRYWFSLKPNLIQVHADRQVTVKEDKVNERVRSEIEEVFPSGQGVEVIRFPEKSSQIPNQAALTLVVLSPDRCMENEKTLEFVDQLTREYGRSGRTFKSALIYTIPEAEGPLQAEARKLLAWEAIRDEREDLRLDEGQKRQLAENLKKSERDLRECVWRTYKNIAFLGKDNSMRVIDLGLVHSSAASTMVDLILQRLRKDGEIEDSISPNFLVRNWPGFTEWSTIAVRDAFFASPQFPRLLDGDTVRGTIARGVANGILAYVGKSPEGGYDPFYFEKSLSAGEVEISEDMFIITAEEAKKHVEPPRLTSLVISPETVRVEPGKKQTFIARGLDQHGREIAVDAVDWSATGGAIDKSGVFSAGEDDGNYVVTVRTGDISGTANVTVSKEKVPPPPPPPPPGRKRLSWAGEVPPQKWMNFYTKVLARFAGKKGLTLRVNVNASPEEGISDQQVEEMKLALRELGLKDDVELGEG